MKTSYNWDSLTYTQKVDHFDPQNDETFEQRYWVYDGFYKEGGPLFYVLGGESPAFTPDEFVVMDYAKENGALVVANECRFYGKSVPTKDLSTENLRFLTTPQVLADYAAMVVAVQEKYKARGIISFGGSYSGSLSAWLRMKYPHLIKGSLAASAPVFAEINFSTYLDTCATVINQEYSAQCLKQFQTALSKAHDMLQTAPLTRELEQMFNVCVPLNESVQQGEFFSLIMDSIAGYIQYGMNISEQCSELVGSSDPLSVMAKWLVTPGSCTENDVEVYCKTMEDIRPYPDNPNAGTRTWVYQTCTEFGWFITGSDSKQPFPVELNVAYYEYMCGKVFGKSLSAPNVDWINTYYGGYDPVDPNVFFTRGSYDPWHTLACDMKNPNLLTYLIDGASHCEDFFPYKPSMPPGIKTAQDKTRQYITDWLKN